MLAIIERWDGEDYEEIARRTSVGAAETVVTKTIGRVHGYIVGRVARAGYCNGVETRKYKTERGECRVLVCT